ncbi:ATP-binding cassette domain-containing protein [Microtetraspora fusca]|uniref:ATP-binding cassette domain-containing protein n=1 Tax=Microtetraspora fusca TaxID=1997 RepID=A0ABW6VIP8_MICFU
MNPLLRVHELGVRFHMRRSEVVAVDGVSFEARKGETVGIVGESGSGKTTLTGAVLGRVPISRGQVVFRGEDVTHATPRRRRELTAELQPVYQDPFSSLNPARTIGQTLEEPLLVHTRLPAGRRRTRVEAALEQVGLSGRDLDRLPREFSGGQRQRIAIARALVAEPSLIVLDEAVSALDLSVQAQILNLLLRLQADLGLTYLFISHDLDVIRHVSHTTVVMRRGQVVEAGPTAEIVTCPASEYTRRLLDSTLVPDPELQAARRGRVI